MISGIGNNVTSLNVMEDKLNVIAGNVANVNSDGYKQRQATISENGAGQLEASVTTLTTQGALVEEGGNTRETSNVDLAKNMTETIPLQANYGANMDLIQTQDRMTGTVIDIVG